MYTHRGAYLNSLGEVIHQGFRDGSSYLWTLPMFHCNGWCTTWALTAVAGHPRVPARGPRGRHLAADRPGRGHPPGRGADGAVDDERVTAGAPAPAAVDRHHRRRPPPEIIETFDDLNVRVVHVYGLTETYGPYTVCEEQDSWSALAGAPSAPRLKARQGVGMLTADDARVVASDRRSGPAGRRARPTGSRWARS